MTIRRSRPLTLALLAAATLVFTPANAQPTPPSQKPTRPRQTEPVIPTPTPTSPSQPAPAAPVIPGQPGQPGQPGGATTCEQELEYLRLQIHQAEQRIKDLQFQNDEMLRRLPRDPQHGQTTPVGQMPLATQIEPMSSPQTIMDTLVRDYNEKVGGLTRTTAPEQAKYRNRAQDWTRDAARTFRGPVDWTIQVIKVDATPGASARPTEVTFQVLDRDGKPLGGQVTQPIPARFIKMLMPDVTPKRFQLSGTATARPTFRADLEDKGVKDNTLFIGPYAEFGFDVMVADIKEIKPQP